MINSKDYKKKLCSTGIELAGINDISPISTLQILEFKYRENANYIVPVEGLIMIGYRSGHLMILKFKDKKTEIIHKFNKSSKK